MSNINNNMQVVTVIDGLGTVEAGNDLVNFVVTVRAKNDHLERAKGSVNEKVEEVMKLLEGLKEKGMKVEGEIENVVTDYKLEHREGNEKMPAGFQSVVVINWTASVDEHLDEIYQTCLKIDSHMSPPIFSIKDREMHINQALLNASENAREKLERECELLGILKMDLKIRDWAFSYDGNLANLNGSNFKGTYHGVMGATGPQGAMGLQGSYDNYNARVSAVATRLGSIYQEPLDFKIKPGSVSFRAAVRINYVFKDKV